MQNQEEDIKFQYGVALSTQDEELYPPQIRKGQLIQPVDKITLTRWNEKTNQLTKFTFSSNYLFEIITEKIGTNEVSITTEGVLHQTVL